MMIIKRWDGSVPLCANMINYREPYPSHFVLDIECRRCGLDGLYSAYWPKVRPHAGPLCRECCIIWIGISETPYAILTADGLRSFPIDYRPPWPDPQHVKLKLIPGTKPTEIPWL